jgi:S-DNA-T family DNA segregation ATPase FtsK/SpoIIIE
VCPVGPNLSIHDPVYVGIDDHGKPVYVPIMYRNLLAGGDPGAASRRCCRTLSPWPLSRWIAACV